MDADTALMDLTYSDSEDSEASYVAYDDNSQDGKHRYASIANPSTTSTRPSGSAMAWESRSNAQHTKAFQVPVTIIKEDGESNGLSGMTDRAHPPSMGRGSDERMSSARKRSRYNTYVGGSPHNHAYHAVRNGPFFEQSSSDDEQTSQARAGAVHAKGSERATAFKQHRRNQLRTSEGHNPPSRPENIKTDEAVDTGTNFEGWHASPAQQVAESGRKKQGKGHTALPRRERVEEETGWASYLLPSGIGAQHEASRAPVHMSKSTARDKLGKPEEKDMTFGHTTQQAQVHNRARSTTEQNDLKDLLRKPDHPPTDNSNLATRSAGAALPSTPASLDTIKRRFVKAPATRPPPKNKHQQWLQHSNKILSRSMRHAGTIGVPQSPPQIQHPLPRTEELTTETSRSQGAPKRDTVQSDHRSQSNERDDNQSTPKSAPSSDITTPNSSPTSPPTKAIDFHGSLVPENDRCVVDWREGGMSWDCMVGQWQKKTGAVANEATLEKRYKAAKKGLTFELNGMKMARRSRRPDIPRTAGIDADTRDSDNNNQRLDSSKDKMTVDPPPPRPTTGGKSFNNEAFTAKMAEIMEAQENEARLENEQANAFFRDQSPQTGEQGDPIYYIYRVLRREWYNVEARHDEQAGPWYRITGPKAEFSTLVEANLVAMQEACQTRNHVGPHMRFRQTLGGYDENDMYRWTFEGQDDRGYEVKVVRELAAVGPGYTEAESKVGWFKKRVWMIKKRTIRKVEVKGDGMFEDDKTEITDHEERLSGVYTTADQANREAAEVLLYSIVKKNSARLDDVDKLSSLQPKLAATCDELEEIGGLFAQEAERERDGSKVKVWVYPDYLVGPRNI